MKSWLVAVFIVAAMFAWYSNSRLNVDSEYVEACRELLTSSTYRDCRNVYGDDYRELWTTRLRWSALVMLASVVLFMISSNNNGSKNDE